MVESFKDYQDLLQEWFDSGQAEIDLIEAAKTSQKCCEYLASARSLDRKTLEEPMTI